MNRQQNRRGQLQRCCQRMGPQQCWCPQCWQKTRRLWWRWRQRQGLQVHCPWWKLQKWVRHRLKWWLQQLQLPAQKSQQTLWPCWQLGLQQVQLHRLVPLVPPRVLLQAQQLLQGLRPLVLQWQRSQRAA